MVWVDCENTSAPNEILSLREPVTLVLDSASTFPRIDASTIQAPFLSTSVRPSIFGSAFTTQHISILPSTVHNVKPSIEGWRSHGCVMRMPGFHFSLAVENLPTDSVKNLFVNLARFIVSLFKFQRRERVEAPPILGWNYFDGETPMSWSAA